MLGLDGSRGSLQIRAEEVGNDLPVESPAYVTSILAHTGFTGETSDFSPKLRDKIRNGKPGFEARGLLSSPGTGTRYRTRTQLHVVTS